MWEGRAQGICGNGHMTSTRRFHCMCYSLVKTICPALPPGVSDAF
jgi:hypothetical protein